MHILWAKTELLHPIDKGGRIRSYHILKELKREHHITYVALDDGAGPAEVASAAEYCHELVRVPFKSASKTSPLFYAEVARSLFATEPYAVWKYRSAQMEEAIAGLVEAGGVDLVVCDFLAAAPNIPERLGCPTVLFEHNVEAEIWRRHAEVAENPLKKVLLKDQHKRMVEYEAAACQRFDHVIAVSEKDAQAIGGYGARNVSHVPTGVDVDFFRPAAGVVREPARLVFTGSMDWLPNEDAMLWFAQAILPLIQARVPQVKLSIVGRSPPAAIRALATKVPAIEVTGRVPDVRPEIDRASIFIVPLRVGGGTRLKIFEAMAMEKPVVSTAIGAEGLGVHDGKDIVIASDPESFAAQVVRLIEDPRAAQAIGKNAGDAVRAEFGWQRVAERFSQICEGVRGAQRPDRPALGDAA